jgi:hypothetical protein
MPSSLNGTGVTFNDATTLQSGNIPAANLGSGTANSTTFLRGDKTWSALPAPVIADGSVTFDKLTTAAAGTVLLRRLTFGNNEILSSTYEAAQPWSNVLGSYSVNIIKAGVVRVRFSHQAVFAGNVARVLKNGSQISEFVENSGDPVQRNVDVSVVAGDYITVQSRSTFGNQSRIINVQILSNQLAIVAV